MIRIIFAFHIGESVKIRVNGRVGRIVSLIVNEGGDKYYTVRYTDWNGAVINDWFNASELKH